MRKAMSIEWHKQCLTNHLASISKEEEHLLREKARVQKNREQYNFYKLQIETAERSKKTKFDRDMYLKKMVQR